MKSMYEILQDMKDKETVGDFLFPAMPRKIKGKVGYLMSDAVWIESESDGQTYYYITHPNHVCIVQKK